MTTSDREDLIQRIQAYLLAHPNAADSLEGIAQWWFGEEEGVPNFGQVEDALNELIKSGVVQIRTNVDGTVIYGRARPFPVQGEKSKPE